MESPFTPQRRSLFRHTLIFTLFALGAVSCGGGGSSPSAPIANSGDTTPDNSTPDLPRSYPASGAIDYRYEPVVATQNIDDDTGLSTSEFSDPVDILGVIHYPLIDAEHAPPAEGFPLILFQHGRHSTCSTTGDANGDESSGTDCEANGLVPIRSDKGYDYIAETMAAQGYVVISIDVNDINAQDSGSNDQGITARAEVILHHLDIFRDISENPTSAYITDAHGNDFSPLAGAIDMSRVGLMGHSRGGNGVAKTITYNKDTRFRRQSEFDQPHEIKAVFSLAPTDFDSELPLDTAWVTLSPYCDGDVSTLHGVYMYDNVRYNENDTAQPQFMITAMGANHNYYNDFWFNDDATLNGFDPYCTESSPTSGRFSRSDQKRHGAFLISSFLRLFAGGETQFAGYWSGAEPAPASACPEGVDECQELLHLSFHQSAEHLIVVDDTLTDASLSQNRFASNTYNGFVLTGWCEPNGGSLDDTLGMNEDRCPSPSTISKAPQVFASYLGSGSMIHYELPDSGLDVSDSDYFTLRMGVSVTPENAEGQDFTLLLRDAAGKEVTLLASEFSKALYFPPGLTVSARDTGAKTVINMLPFPLDATAIVDGGLDLTALTDIEVHFDQRTSGTVQITDVLFQKVPYKEGAL
ncbi:MAG: hypothetical protein R3221_04350 [Spongiibacter sp.]|nr:hypothetical protein [Spongiibacter sp.]